MQEDGVVGGDLSAGGQSVARAIIVMAVEDLTSEAGSLKNAGSVAR
jgi:hypothetical protein